LSKLDELIQLIQNDEQIQRFKELELVIDHNQDIQEKFNKLLELQKRMVQQEVQKHKNYPQSKTAYDKAYQDLRENLLVEEYLELLEYINNDINFIQSIIEQEIAKDFD